MSLRINTNVDALTAYRNLTSTQSSMSTSLERLSSGLRINKAADDAAGLAISQGLTSQINGIGQAVRNAQDGINVVQTADGALTETQSILQRMNTLGVQAANDSNDDSSRQDIQTEITALNSELDRISSSTSFNGVKLLDGSFTNKSFQVGATSAAYDQIGVTVTSGSAAPATSTVTGSIDLTALKTAGLVINHTPASGSSDTQTTVDLTGLTKDFTDTAVGAGTGSGDDFVSTQHLADYLNKDSNFSGAFSASVSNGALKVVAKDGGATALNLNSAFAGNPAADQLASSTFDSSAITGGVSGKFDITFGSTTLAKGVDISGITTDSGVADKIRQSIDTSKYTVTGDDTAHTVTITAISPQVGHDGDQIKIADENGTASGIANTATAGTGQLSKSTETDSAATSASGGFGSADLGTSAIDMTTQAGAKASLDIIAKALQNVSTARANLGALQNRFQHTINNLSVTQQNLQASNSSITDTDMAAEMSNFTRAQILSQAGTSMLKQANQASQGVLSLLQ